MNLSLNLLFQLYTLCLLHNQNGFQWECNGLCSLYNLVIWYLETMFLVCIGSISHLILWHTNIVCQKSFILNGKLIRAICRSLYLQYVLHVFKHHTCPMLSKKRERKNSAFWHTTPIYWCIGIVTNQWIFFPNAQNIQIAIAKKSCPEKWSLKDNFVTWVGLLYF